MNQKKNLLPIGFRDILTNEADLQFEYGQKLVKNFNSWGYSFIEPPIIEYEKTISIKKYIVGINDCRHYVDKLSRFCLNKGLPIWKLNELMDS